MKDIKKNYSVINAGPLESLSERIYESSIGPYHGKYFIGQDLGLTGCECSLSRIPKGVGMPFVHAHKENEELYIVIRGKGTFYIDGEEFPIQEGSLIRVDPPGARAWKADDEDLYIICIQTKAGSLNQATRQDGIIIQEPTSWLKTESN